MRGVHLQGIVKENFILVIVKGNIFGRVVLKWGVLLVWSFMTGSIVRIMFSLSYVSYILTVQELIIYFNRSGA